MRFYRENLHPETMYFAAETYVPDINYRFPM